MNRRTLGWVGLLLALVTACFCLRTLREPSNRGDVYAGTKTVPAPQPAQSSSSESRASEKEDALNKAMSKAAAVLARSNEHRKSYRDRQSQDDRERQAKYKIERYERLLMSWNLDPEAIAEALKILAKRDTKLDEIDSKMLDKLLLPHIAARNKREERLDALKELSGILGVEMSAQFDAWDSQKNKKSEID